jgi:hypothetical protein
MSSYNPTCSVSVAAFEAGQREDAHYLAEKREEALSEKFENDKETQKEWFDGSVTALVSLLLLEGKEADAITLARAEYKRAYNAWRSYQG